MSNKTKSKTKRLSLPPVKHLGDSEIINLQRWEHTFLALKDLTERICNSPGLSRSLSNPEANRIAVASAELKDLGEQIGVHLAGSKSLLRSAKEFHEIQQERLTLHQERAVAAAGQPPRMMDALLRQADARGDTVRRLEGEELEIHLLQHAVDSAEGVVLQLLGVKAEEDDEEEVDEEEEDDDQDEDEDDDEDFDDEDFDDEDFDDEDFDDDEEEEDDDDDEE